jgi:hypothetical protein
MTSIFDKFKDVAIRRREIILFSNSDALLVINEARVKRVPILGIDGLFIEGEKIRPSMDHSIDFTAKGADFPDRYSEAERFLIRHSNHDLYFEIVLDE